MKLNKKAMTWQQLVLAILAIVVVTFVIIWFQKGGTSAYGSLGEKISALGDCDKDNVADMFDKCPKCPATGVNKDFPGCPSTVKKETDITSCSAIPECKKTTTTNK